MLNRTRSVFAAGILAAGAALTMAGPSTAAVAPNSAVSGAAYAPAATAKIHPGVMMYTDGAQCTANFVFADGAGNTYVGYAAHCAGQGAATDTNGCDTTSLPLGTKVTFNEGGSLVDEGTQVGTGTLAYSSWLTMQKKGEQDTNTCAYNDLALVKVDSADVSKVNPSVPFWGGPTGVDTDRTAAGDRVYTYGNSSLRAGIQELSPHTGSSVGDDAADGGWSHPLYTVTPLVGMQDVLRDLGSSATVTKVTVADDLSNLDEARNAAQEADAVVLMAGMVATEGADQPDANML